MKPPPNRYANLNRQVWNAILRRDPTGLAVYPATAGQPLSPLGVYNDLNGAFNRNFYPLDPNGTQARVVQLALKFYF